MEKLPNEYQNVFITYEAEIGYGPYGIEKRKEIVRRRAFYSNSKGYYDRNNQWIETDGGYFSVPQFWDWFYYSDGTKAILPKGFSSYPKVFPSQIIKWECDNREKL